MGDADTRKHHPTVLVAEVLAAQWEPTRGGKGMDEANALRRAGADAILAAIVPELGGVWTDRVDGLEVIRLGHPVPPRPSALDPFDPTPLADNVFVRHWERIVFGRAVDVVWTPSGQLAGPLRRALSGQRALWWAGVEKWDEWQMLARTGTTQRGPLAAPACFLAEPRAGPPPGFVGRAEVECVPRTDWISALVHRLECLS